MKSSHNQNSYFKQYFVSSLLMSNSSRVVEIDREFINLKSAKQTKKSVIRLKTTNVSLHMVNSDARKLWNYKISNFIFSFWNWYINLMSLFFCWVATILNKNHNLDLDMGVFFTLIDLINYKVHKMNQLLNLAKSSGWYHCT